MDKKEQVRELNPQISPLTKEFRSGDSEESSVPQYISAIVKQLTQFDNVELITFDVFDTVLTNVLDHPEAVFLQIGRLLEKQKLIPISPEAFARARSEAERRIRELTDPGNDVTLSQIYEEFIRFHRWAQDSIHDLMDCEIAIERKITIPLPGIKSVVDWARENVGQIAFVSDMYMPTSFIGDLLRDHGLLAESDRLFVSGDCGVRKGHNGDLFRHVLNVMGVSPDHSVHVGNDWMVDVVSARQVGMRAVYSSNGNLNRYEKVLNLAHWNTLGAASLYAGASRKARLTALTTGYNVDDQLLPVCAGVAAPLITDYALWLLREGSELGLKCLFFLSREAEVLFEVARELAEGLGFDIELRYLYVSRRSLNLALLHNTDRAELEWALTGFQNDTLDSLLSRLGLSRAQLSEQLATSELGGMSASDLLSREKFDALLDVFEDKKVRKLIEDHAHSRRELVDGYLAQEGFFKCEAVGLVDTTGVGSQFRVLQKLRARHVSAPLRCFLMVRIWQPKLDYSGFPEIQGYYCDQYAYQRPYSIPGLTSILEIFCAGSHGSVVGYRRTSSGSVDPEFEILAGYEDRQQYTNHVRLVVEGFAKAIVMEPTLLDLTLDRRRPVIEAYRLFWESPSRQEACSWGRYPLEGGSISTLAQKMLASPLSFRDLIHIQLHNSSASFLGQFAWRAGAEQVSSPGVRSTIVFFAWTKNISRTIGKKFSNRIKMLWKRIK